MPWPVNLSNLHTTIDQADSTAKTSEEHDLEHNSVNAAVNQMQLDLGVSITPAIGSLRYQLADTVGGHNHSAGNSRALTAAAPIRVTKNGGGGITESKLDFIEGGNIQLTLTDDVVNGIVRLQIDSTATGTGSAQRSATVVVAATNATNAEKTAADYIVGGTGTSGVATSTATIALQTANNFCSALPNGGHVVLSSGTFNVTSKVLVDSFVKFSGQGEGTKVNISGGTWVAGDAAFTGRNVNVEGIEICDMWIGGWVNGVSGISLDSSGGSTSRHSPDVVHDLHNLRIINVGQDAIALIGSASGSPGQPRGSKLHDIRIFSCTRYGIYMPNAPDCFLSQIDIGSANSDGFFHGGGGNTTVTDMKVWYSGGNGANLNGDRCKYDIDAQDNESNGIFLSGNQNRCSFTADHNSRLVPGGGSGVRITAAASENIVDIWAGAWTGAATQNYGLNLVSGADHNIIRVVGSNSVTATCNVPNSNTADANFNRVMVV